MEEVGQRDGGEGSERLGAVERVVNALGPPPSLQNCTAMVGSQSGWPPAPCRPAWPLGALPSKPALLGAGGGGEGFHWAVEEE